MEAIKLATPEQVERIKEQSDLEVGSVVLALGEDLAVVRAVTELNPAFFDEKSTTQRRLMFIWGIENWLRLTNVPAYYFRAHPDNEAWLKVIKTHGAEQVSTAPELTFKKVL